VSAEDPALKTILQPSEAYETPLFNKINLVRPTR